jgi:hypothetical protein
MIAGVVEHYDDAAAARSLAQQSLEETLEGLGIEHFAHHAHELSGAQADGAKAGHRLAGRRMLQDGVLDLRRHLHAASRTVLLEVTFLQAPQFNVGASGQAAKVCTAAIFSGSD